MTLQPLDTGLWHAESVLPSFGVRFPLRMTVMETDHGLTLWSPIAIDDALAAAIDALGTVRTIVAPNRFHHLFARAAADRWPEATLLAADGVAKKNKSLAGATPLDGASLPGLTLTKVHGAPTMSEVVAFHQPSRSLITTDLLFHIHEAEGWMSRMVFKYVARTLGKAQQSRLWKGWIDDQQAAQASLEALLALPFERLVMAHGELIHEGGPEALAKACIYLRSPSPS